MKHRKETDSPQNNEDPAAQQRSRDSFAKPTDSPDDTEATVLAQADATLTLLSAWVNNLQTLARLELNRNLTAGKRIALLVLVLYPLAIALLLSLCGAVGLAVYHFSQSIYIAFAAFVLAQVLIVAGIVLYQRRLLAMLGFNQTRQQAKEALDDVFALFK
ncbi:hypothetical protein [Microbulbifer sp. SAOS-129_SWC]|uniref:hypothetical protein n=1 Tax=Microbulbifer sp. SAOS-129_SWC TaxID=3145235 RepID=UPI003216402A